MPDASTPRRPDRPTEGFSTVRLPAPAGRPVRLFLPADYQPKYAYPLVVVLHADSADEDAAALLAPRLSRRNYVVVCPRGSVSLGTEPTGRPKFGWGTGDDNGLLAAVAHARREFHVHPDRLYVVGVGSGAAAACRLARRATGAAGLVLLNATPPARAGKSAGRLRVFVGHGLSNPVVPASAARRASRLFSAAGADVRFQTYPAAQHVTDDMLRDVNRWIMGAVSADPDTAAFPI